MTCKSRVRARKGFTLIEIMVALAVMTVGVMGTLALQRQVVVSNRHARRVDIATQIAENWLERLRIDATQWPNIALGGAQAAAFPVPATVVANTLWLNAINGAGGGGVNVWMPIVINTTVAPGIGSGPNISNAFDYQGQDIIPGGANPHAYCASYRLNWTRFQPPAFPRGIRADIRVWWPRERSGVGPTTAPFSNCGDAGANVTGGPYHAVYVSTVMAPR